MATPTITVQASETIDTGATSLAVAMPSGVASGKKLLVHLCAAGSNYIDMATDWSGWTVLADRVGQTGCRNWIAWKNASGSETTVTTNIYSDAGFTTPATVEFIAQVYLIAGVDTTAPAYAAGTTGSVAPDPPSVSGWSGEDNLYLGLYGTSGNESETAIPSGTTSIVAADNVGLASGVTVGGAYIGSTAASYDMASWTMASGVSACTAFAIAIRPSGSSSVAPIVAYYQSMQD